MSKTWLAAISTVALMTVSPALTHAKDISTKKLSLKDNAKPAKRQVAVQSTDAGVRLMEADDPGANGAAVHVYSATDDFCAILPSGANWKHTSSQWKYANKATKTSAHVGNGKLVVEIKSGVTYSLADNRTQGTVNVQVQFGSGTRYCMRCSAAKKDTAKKRLQSLQHDDDHHQHHAYQHHLPDRPGPQGVSDGHPRSLQLQLDARASRLRRRLQHEFPGHALVHVRAVAGRGSVRPHWPAGHGLQPCHLLLGDRFDGPRPLAVRRRCHGRLQPELGIRDGAHPLPR